MATIDEYFLDDVAIENLQGVSLVINRPTKHVSNPIMGNASWTWDRDINFVHALPDGSGGVRLWYLGYENLNVHCCYATSTDGLTFTRPNLGLVSFGGNTNNNLIADFYPGGVYFDDTLTPKYLAISAEKIGEAYYGVYLWSSADGLTWSAVQTLYAGPGDGNYKEGRQIQRLANGRWLAHYIGNGLADRRSPGAFLSDTTNPAGTWKDLGLFLAATSADDQRYHFTHAQYGDVYVGISSRFVRSTELIDNVELHVSRDGITWRSLDKTWFAVGTSGAWDDSMIINSMPFVEIGNEYYSYYTGFPTDHASAVPREARVGVVKIAKGRIGQIGTTGTVRLKPQTLGASDTLTVNCNASGGSLKVELLDEQNRVIYGYSRDDCDPITTDTYSTAVTWDGRGLIASRTVKVVFVLDNATLHHCQIGAA